MGIITLTNPWSGYSVQGNGPVDFGVYTVMLKKVSQLVPACYTDNIEVMQGMTAKRDPQSAQTFVIVGADLPSFCQPLVQVSQLNTQDSRLNFIDSGCDLTPIVKLVVPTA